MKNKIPAGLGREHLLAALSDLKDSLPHPFGNSTRYDLLYQGERYPPKAVVGIAAGKLLGTPLGPYDFKGGSETICFKCLEENGFEIVPKETVQKPASARNPKWSRDELILALDLYFRHPPLSISKVHPEVVSLSALLNNLGEKLRRIENGKFRNPNGVYMKLCNYLRLDASYKGAGLKGGGKLEEEVWTLFANNRGQLTDTASSIVATLTGEAQAFEAETDADEAEFPEGAVLYRAHRRRERNQKLVKDAKAAARRKSAYLRCEVCTFSFFEGYGTLGENFIECHHTIPVSSMKPGDTTLLKDIVLLCSNCHRMVHRRKSGLSVEGLRSVWMSALSESDRFSR